MEFNSPYNGKRRVSRRRRASAAPNSNRRAKKSAVKLFICVILFAAAALVKLAAPTVLSDIGDKINSAVNYKEALAVLGEGISGEKKFTSALSEAFTYAFTGGQASDNENPNEEAESESVLAPSVGTSPDVAEGSGNDAVKETSGSAESKETAEAGVPAFADNSAAAAENTEQDFSNAVVSAFQQDQAEYSDYAIPAGVTYGMPKLMLDITMPVKGIVSSSFGYRVHPTEKTVLFHYGTDIAADKGTAIVALADGKVLATGESDTLGKYVILSHGVVESEYAHCGNVCVTSGQTVIKGERIATVGDTGNATDSCLHFELKISGVNVNPTFYIKWQ